MLADRETAAQMWRLNDLFGVVAPYAADLLSLAVFEHLAAHGLIIGATHDLDVAKLLGDEFRRAYFAEDASGSFDRTPRTGVAPSTNAVELLARAGYPREVLSRVERCRARSRESGA